MEILEQAIEQLSLPLFYHLRQFLVKDIPLWDLARGTGEKHKPADERDNNKCD